MKCKQNKYYYKLIYRELYKYVQNMYKIYEDNNTDTIIIFKC